MIEAKGMSHSSIMGTAAIIMIISTRLDNILHKYKYVNALF